MILSGLLILLVAGCGLTGAGVQQPGGPATGAPTTGTPTTGTPTTGTPTTGTPTTGTPTTGTPTTGTPTTGTPTSAGPTSASASAPTSAASSPPASGSSAPSSIRQFAFATAGWYDANRKQRLQLAGGTGSSHSVSYLMGGKPVFGDLNGDGAEDAVVRLRGSEGNGWWDYAYAWLWDPAKKTAVQLQVPVIDDVRCGNQTTVAGIGGGLIKITKKVRATEACAQTPQHVASMSIQLQGGVWPVLVSPTKASVDSCQKPASDFAPASDVLPKNVYLAKSTKAPSIPSSGLGTVSIGGNDSGPVTVEGFDQVLFHAKGDNTTYYCVYIKH